MNSSNLIYVVIIFLREKLVVTTFTSTNGYEWIIAGRYATDCNSV